MGNRKRLLTGSRQTGKQKPESGSDGNRNLKIGENGPGMDRRAWNDATGLGRHLFQRINAWT